MLFCPKCQSLLRSKTVNGSVINFCSCGYEVNSSKRMIVSEKIDYNDEIVESSEINPLACEDHTCPKCGFKKAVLVGSQIAVRETAGCCETDRPAFICGKCGFKDFL